MRMEKTDIYICVYVYIYIYPLRIKNSNECKNVFAHNDKLVVSSTRFLFEDQKIGRFGPMFETM